MGLQKQTTREMYQRAAQVMPYGVNSNFRYWGEDDTLVIERGQGPYIWDADGNRYIDYRLGFGPIILGHAHPAVVDHVREAIGNGTLFAWTTPLEIEVAERICRMTGAERVRLANSGTEAAMHALRLARAHTGRECFLKFEGQYHGMADYFLYSTASSVRGSLGSRRSPIVVPSSSGIPLGISQYVTVLPFNDTERLEEVVEARWSELAAIFVEPLLGNAAAVMPAPGFLEQIRQLCDRYGIVMVMDEVKTGFRIARGGAQEYFGVQADLATYAKALGNGFPIAAIGGREQIMMTIEPGSVAHGGTFTGNVVGTAAAAATLELLESEPIIESILEKGRLLMSGLGEILSDAGIPHFLTGVPSIFGIGLGSEDPPTDFRGYLEADADLYEKLMLKVCQNGVMPDVDGREPWFLSYSHDEEVIADTLQRFEDTVRAFKE